MKIILRTITVLDLGKRTAGVSKQLKFPNLSWLRPLVFGLFKDIADSRGGVGPGMKKAGKKPVGTRSGLIFISTYNTNVYVFARINPTADQAVRAPKRGALFNYKNQFSLDLARDI